MLESPDDIKIITKIKIIQMMITIYKDYENSNLTDKQRVEYNEKVNREIENLNELKNKYPEYFI